MFQNKKEIVGTHYYEFQYCKKEKSFEELFKNLKNWEEDSLYLNEMDNETMYLFEEKYLNYFLNTLTPNGKHQYDPFGDNYYSKEQSKSILNELLVTDLPDKNVFCKWLKKCVENYNGFYILGI